MSGDHAIAAIPSNIPGYLLNAATFDAWLVNDLASKIALCATPAAQSRTRPMPPIMTGLSGNEIYCLGLKGFAPGELVVGNSVHSLGFLGGLGAGLKGIMGGEVEQVTDIIREGRLLSHARIMQEAKDFGAHGVTGVTSEKSLASCMMRACESSRPSRM